MKLTDDQKVQIFCAALTASIQAHEAMAVASGHTGSGIGAVGPVAKASQWAAEAIAKLQSKDWA